MTQWKVGDQAFIVYDAMPQKPAPVKVTQVAGELVVVQPDLPSHLIDVAEKFMKAVGGDGVAISKVFYAFYQGTGLPHPSTPSSIFPNRKLIPR
jgi:hypothetical protein